MTWIFIWHKDCLRTTVTFECVLRATEHRYVKALKGWNGLSRSLNTVAAATNFSTKFITFNLCLWLCMCVHVWFVDPFFHYALISFYSLNEQGWWRRRHRCCHTSFVSRQTPWMNGNNKNTHIYNIYIHICRVQAIKWNSTTVPNDGTTIVMP